MGVHRVVPFGLCWAGLPPTGLSRTGPGWIESDWAGLGSAGPGPGFRGPGWALLGRAGRVGGWRLAAGGGAVGTYPANARWRHETAVDASTSTIDHNSNNRLSRESSKLPP
ncbi:hypothetical protein GCM10023324_65810 [Streptomyces youssoufiensis]